MSARVMPMNDPTRITTGIAAVLGGLVWSMRHILNNAMAPTMDDSPESKRLQRKAYVEALFCAISAGIGGFGLAPAVLKHFNVTSVETASAFGVVFGLGFWAAVPILTSIGPAVAGTIKGVALTYAKRMVGGENKEDPE